MRRLLDRTWAATDTPQCKTKAQVWLEILSEVDFLVFVGIVLLGCAVIFIVNVLWDWWLK